MLNYGDSYEEELQSWIWKITSQRGVMQNAASLHVLQQWFKLPPFLCSVVHTPQNGKIVM